MEQMANQNSLYLKIVQVMSEVGQLSKDGSVKDMNGKKMYDYLSEENTTAALQAAFIKHKLVMFPITVEDELIYIESIKRGELIKAPITRVKVTYRIVDAETGAHQDLQSIGYGSDSQDKGSNKAMTGAFKYCQRQTFMISTGDDGDHTASDVLDEQFKTPSTRKEQPKDTGAPSQPQKTDTTASNTPSGALISEAQINYALKLKKSKQINDADFRRMISEHNSDGIGDVTQLPKKQASEFINFLNNYGAVGA